MNQDLGDTLDACGQSHLLHYFNTLSVNEKNSLVNQISAIDIHEACDYFKKCTVEPATETDNTKIEPIPQSDCASLTDLDSVEVEKYWNVGLEAVSNNEVGVILLAGGQGTRLGVEYPKGMFTVGLPSGKSLLQLQAERILKLQSLAKAAYPSGACLIQWYVMTSAATDDSTKEFFSTNNNFGLKESQIKFFQQGQLPCFTFDGKIIMDSKHSLAVAPDGNGGLYKAVLKCGLIAEMRSGGVKYLHVYCVDNVLVRVADPSFFGFCISREADCGAKVVEKTDPNEPVGVVCRMKGEGPRVVEYSEISDDTAALRDSENSSKLAFRAGNICNHFFTLTFLENVCSAHEKDLIHHVAKKKIPYLDQDGNLMKPTKPNGIKMEKFVFDVFTFSKKFLRKFVVWETPRNEEFSPLKNADAAGRDCASTCRDDVFRLHASWIRKAGGMIESTEKTPAVEIAPVVSYGGEGLEMLVQGRVLRPPIYLKELFCSDEVNGTA